MAHNVRMKKCKICQLEKEESNFRLLRKKYLQSYCLPCEKEKSLAWAKDNRAKATETARIYRQANKEQHAESVKRYNAAHPDRRRKTHRTYIADRKLNDLNFKLACAIRCRLGVAIKDNAKSGSAVADLGCTIPELRAHLESKFKPGMTWDNWSKDGWHIDHIRPLAKFDLENREQFLEAVHYTNLQPLWASENIHKSAKLD
jgi:hypothetical protein